MIDSGKLDFNGEQEATTQEAFSQGDNNMVSNRRVGRILTVLLLLIGWGGISAFAQFSSGIEGTVHDTTGAIVAGAGDGAGRPTGANRGNFSNVVITFIGHINIAAAVQGDAHGKAELGIQSIRRTPRTSLAGDGGHQPVVSVSLQRQLADE